MVGAGAGRAIAAAIVLVACSRVRVEPGSVSSGDVTGAGGGGGDGGGGSDGSAGHPPDQPPFPGASKTADGGFCETDADCGPGVLWSECSTDVFWCCVGWATDDGCMCGPELGCTVPDVCCSPGGGEAHYCSEAAQCSGSY